MSPKHFAALEAASVAARAHAEEVQFGEPVSETCLVGGLGVTVTFFHNEAHAPPSAEPSPPVPTEEPLTEIQQAVIEAARDNPVSQEKLATLAGYGRNPNFYNAVAQLLEMGLIVRVRGGIRLPRRRGH